MRKLTLVLILMFTLMPVHILMAQVQEKTTSTKDTLNISRDSLVRLIRIKDSLLISKRRDSILMSRTMTKLEYYRDSLNAELNESIYRQKLDSAEQMRRYLNYRDFNRRTRQELYSPIGIIDKDSIRSSMKEVVDRVFEDTAYNPKPQYLKSSMDRLLHHLANDSVYFRIMNTKEDIIPFTLKKDRCDSAAFFVMNSKNDSAKIYIRGLDKNTLSISVGEDLMLKHLLKKQSEFEVTGFTWQDPNKLRIPRRVVPIQVPKLWFLRSELSLTTNQNTFINWSRGGTNNIGLLTDVKAWANFAKGNIKWDNSLWFVYGVQKTEMLSLRKSADRIYIVSSLSHKAFKNFDYTLGSTFETQGFKGFVYPNDSVPVSKFMAPAYLNISLGMTYIPNPKLKISGSPISSKLTFVLDTVMIDQTRFGLRPDQRMNAQLGARVTIDHSTHILKNVTMINFLELFSNYIDHPEKINFDWRLSLGFRINRYILTTLNTEMIYDNRMLLPIYKYQDGKKVEVGKGKRIQFSEVFGITVKYILY